MLRAVVLGAGVREVSMVSTCPEWSVEANKSSQKYLPRTRSQRGFWRYLAYRLAMG